MAVKLPSGDYWYSIEINKTHREKRAILVTTPNILTGLNVLSELTIKAANSWLGYKWPKVKPYEMEALYKNDKLFDSRL